MAKLGWKTHILMVFKETFISFLLRPYRLPVSSPGIYAHLHPTCHFFYEINKIVILALIFRI